MEVGRLRSGIGVTIRYQPAWLIAEFTQLCWIESSQAASAARFVKEPAQFKKGIQRRDGLGSNDPVKRPVGSEIQMRRDTRKSIIVRRALRAGQTITADDLIVKRPSWGIPPREWDRVLGRTARRDVEPETPLTWDLV